MGTQDWVMCLIQRGASKVGWRSVSTMPGEQSAMKTSDSKKQPWCVNSSVASMEIVSEVYEM